MTTIALIQFLRKYWAHIAVAVVTAAFLALVYWEGGRAPRAELAELRAKIERDAAIQEMQDEADVAQSQEIVDGINREHEERHNRLNSTWAAVLAGVRAESAGKPTAQPIHSSPQVCADKAGNDRLRDSVDDFRAEVRGAFDELRGAARESREEAARLLAVCHKQAGDLDEIVRWREKEEPIWQDGAEIRLR